MTPSSSHEEVQFFNHFLREKNVSNDLRSLLYHIARSIKFINFSLRAGNTIAEETQNASGDTQIKIDLISDKIIARELEKSGLACIIASEEQRQALSFSCPRTAEKKYGVSYDPIDGGSIIDANFAIGSIFAVWENPGNFIGKTGESIIVSAYAVYGPRVKFVIAIKNNGVHEFELNDVGEFVLTRENIRIENDAKCFAPGNLRATVHDEKYWAYTESCMRSEMTIRYSGGLVPDLHHILSKGQGIFTYPVLLPKYPEGKLRLLYECFPFSFIFEEAGGVSLNQKGNRILETKITDIHQRTPIFIGSKNEVVRAMEFMK